MNDKQNSLSVSDVFDSLVRNAIDFCQHSFIEFENDPKYSVIHFYASVELFFKARLLLEHWSLILADPKNANYQKFLQGDFASVGLEDSIQRLSGISGENFDKQEQKAFSYLKSHRNRLMHFYHAEYQNRDSKLLSDIAAEQCRGWYYLHKLITVNWRSNFEPYFEQISELQSLMKKQKDFLNIRFEHLQKKIAEEKSQGITYIDCPSCGFAANRCELSNSHLINTTCLVCEGQSLYILTICPECNQTIFVDQESACPICKKEIPYWEIMSTLPNSVDEAAYCSNCEYSADPTVVKFGDEWLCLLCFTKYKNWEVKLCEWCGETVTGEVGDQFHPGCFMCLLYIEQEVEEMEEKELPSSSDDT